MKTTNILAIALLAAMPVASMAQANPNGMTHEQFQHLDKDNSGTVSEAEYFQFMEGAFKELDTDRNNSLSPEETSTVMSAEQFSKVDTDGNGRVTRQEFLDQVMSDFHRHDSNKDGELHP